MTSTYEFEVEGHLDGHWSDFLGELTLRQGPNGTTTLTGAVEDQARLHGILGRLRDLGASLVSLRGVPEREAPVAGPLDRLAWPRRTERLEIRPARAEDAEATWRFRRLEGVGRWLTEVPTDLEGYTERFCAPSRLATTLVVGLEGRIVGDLMLRVEDAWGQAEVAEQARGTQAELGWALDPAATGRGYATEAVRELLRICFEELGLRRVTAACFADNEPSWRLMERVGMRREQHAVADALHRSGAWLDTYGYAMTATDWPGASCVAQ
ncbi:MAG TPA: GNAT family N-acetyltransferase [Pedococcus sp.]